MRIEKQNYDEIKHQSENGRGNGLIHSNMLRIFFFILSLLWKWNVICSLCVWTWMRIVNCLINTSRCTQLNRPNPINLPFMYYNIMSNQFNANSIVSAWQLVAIRNWNCPLGPFSKRTVQFLFLIHLLIYLCIIWSLRLSIEIQIDTNSLAWNCVSIINYYYIA